MSLFYLCPDSSVSSEVSHCASCYVTPFIFNQAFWPHRLCSMTAWQAKKKNLFSLRYKISLSVYSSGDWSRDRVKANNITYTCSRYIRPRLLWGKQKWGGGSWFRTSLFCLSSRRCLLEEWNHITDKLLSPRWSLLSLPPCPSILLLYLSFCPWIIPEGHIGCHPSHLRGFCSLTTEQPVVPWGVQGAVGGGKRRDTYRPEEWNGRQRERPGCGQNRVQYRAYHIQAHVRNAVLQAWIAVRCCRVWAGGAAGRLSVLSKSFRCTVEHS